MLQLIFQKITDLHTYLPLIPFLFGLLLKVLLDLNLGKWLVKYFYWLSFRGIFRSTSHNISGIYKQHWQIENNKRYEDKSDRQSLITLKQINNYCYGEFTAKGGKEKYYLFGIVIDRKIIGHWSSLDTNLDYFGSFELTIVNSGIIKGIWIGHSNENPVVINQHEWFFKAITAHNTFLPFSLISRWLKGTKKDTNGKLIAQAIY